MLKRLVIVIALLLCLAPTYTTYANDEPLEVRYERYDSKKHEITDKSKIRFPDSFYSDNYERVYLVDSFGIALHVNSRMGDSIFELTESALPADIVIKENRANVYDEIL